MAAQVGSAFIAIRPSLVGFHKQIAKDLKSLSPQIVKIGVDLGKDLRDGIARGLGDPISGPLQESTDKQKREAPRRGDEVAGAFAKGFQTRLKAAFAALPKAQIDAESSAADRKIANLRARMQELSGKTVGVDLDAGEALAEIAAIKAELASLGRDTPDIQVRADTARAAAELGAVQAEVDRLDSDTARVRVDADVSGALSGIGMVGVALAGLAAIPVGATLGAGILSLVPALGAVGAGFGGLAAVAVPSIARIKDALTAQRQAEAQSAAGAVQAQSRALAQAAARQQLAAAVRNAAAAHAQALQQVKSAQQQLTSAEQAAANAERALTAARKAAQRQLQDIANSVIDAQLAVRQSTFDVADAQSAYNKVAADPRATKDQIARAKLALDQAKQNLTEQQLALKRLKQDQAAADKAGVDGSDQVRSARQQLAAANRQVTTSELALASARANVARVDQSSADQLAAARRGVTQASLQGAGANSKLAASMAALSPAERRLMRDWQGLTSAFQSWARSLQPAVLPLFSRGINLVKDALPGLTPIVKGAAGAVDGLLTDVANAARSPFWQQFRTNLTNLVPTAIGGLGRSAGNVITGLTGIVGAFLPYAPTILGFVQRITAAFASWGKNLGTSNGFQRLMAYVQQNAPLVLKTLTQLAQTIGHVVSSLAPLGPGILGGFGLLLRFIGMLKPGEIQAIAVGFGVLSTAIWAVNFAMNANPVVLVITGIVALVAAIVLAFNHVTWFHNAVVAAWNGIKTAALFVWNSVLKPVFTALTIAVRAVATAALWLWRNVLVPAFNAISLAARILFAVVAVAVLAPLIIAFNILKAVVLAWWHLAVVPAFNAVKLIISAAWAVIRPVLNILGAAIRAVGSAAMWLWRNAIVPAWNGIAAAMKAVYGAVIRPVLSAINSVIRNVIGPVFRWVAGVIKPVWSGIGSVIRTVWETVIKRAFDALKTGVNAVKNAFSVAVTAIGRIWKGLEGATKKPVQFVVNTVYNGKSGIRGVWNKIAGLVHLPELPEVKFARGGVLPGYTPGRDPHTFYSPTGGTVQMSGGEAIMRPEWTRAVGPGFVYAANQIARKRGPGGVRDWLANGNAKFSRGGVFPGGGPVQSFGLGGIFDAIKHAGSLVVHGASSLLDAGASAFAKHALNPILGKIPGADSTFARAIYSLPKRMIDGFIGWLKNSVDPKLGGDGHGVVAAAKKYVGIGDDRGPNNNIFTRAWGMPGAPWCAMFVSTAIKDAHAQKYYPGYPTAAVAGYNGAMRHVPTGSGRPGDLGVYGGGAHINIIEKKAGGAYMTIGGNQNALVQRRVRGGQTSVLRPKFAMGGILGRQARQIFRREAPHNADPHEMQTPLVRLMRSLPAGQMGHVARAIVRQNLAVTNAGVYDDGGVIPPGLNLIANASRKPEAVLSSAQWSTIARAAGGDGATYETTYNLYHRDMTVRDLEGLQRQQEARQRVGRPR